MAFAAYLASVQTLRGSGRAADWRHPWWCHPDTQSNL